MQQETPARRLLHVVKALVVKDDSVAIVKQYRPHRGGETFELPGGKVEFGELAEDAIRRELREETGLVAGALTLLGSFTLGGTSVAVDLYFTDVIEQIVPQQLDVDEYITVVYAPISEVQRRVASGEWPDLRLAVALSMAKARRLL